jgi:hypothetical protein
MGPNISARPTQYKEANFEPERKADKEAYHKLTGGPTQAQQAIANFVPTQSLAGGLPQGPPDG